MSNKTNVSRNVMLLSKRNIYLYFEVKINSIKCQKMVQ